MDALTAKARRRQLLAQRIDKFDEENSHLVGESWWKAFSEMLGVPPASIIALTHETGYPFKPTQHLDKLLKLIDENRGELTKKPSPQMGLFDN